MTRSRKQPVFDIKRKIYFKARFKYILPLFRSLHLLESGRCRGLFSKALFSDARISSYKQRAYKMPQGAQPLGRVVRAAIHEYVAHIVKHP